MLTDSQRDLINKQIKDDELNSASNEQLKYWIRQLEKLTINQDGIIDQLQEIVTRKTGVKFEK
jgi:hypothetical protein